MRIQAKWERATESKGDNTTAWEKLLPTFDFSFRADRADSKPSSAVQSPPIRARSFFSFFPFLPHLSPSSLTVQDTSPRHRPVALRVARKHPPHLPSRTCRPPLRRRRRHNHHHLNASTTGATSPTPSPYNPRHPPFPHRQGVQKVRWPPPFPRDPHLLTLPLCVGRSTRVAAPVAPPGLRAPPRPARVLPCMPGGAGGTARP